VPSHTLGQISTLRDALLAGLSLDIFHRHADRVGMANLAQLVNCLQSLFVADGDRFVITPNYHVFDMYKGHMGARAVRSVFSAPDVSYDRNGREAAVWGLNGSASVSGNTLTLTAVNPNPDAPIEAEIAVRGGRVTSGTVRTLTAGALHAHNSFEQPDAVPAPAMATVPAGGDTLVMTFPRASVSALTLTLG
jgi:alpha-N-arabinofuranosidase